MRRALLAFCVACALTPGDYKEPTTGLTGTGGVEQCRANPLLPCGWVYQCGRETELCIPWQDRAQIPKLREMAESLYGTCSLSEHPRFAGVPLCYYQCPSAQGCNAFNGCFCLDTP
jgi:hypothetical protein